MASYLVSVPKLKGRDNYEDWAFSAKHFLNLEGLKKYITLDVYSTDTASVEEDAKTMSKLIMTIDSSVFSHIRDATTTKQLWDKLKEMFDDSGFSRRISLLRSLISIRLEKCVSMAAYVNQMVETSQRLRGTGFKIDEEWVGSLLLAGLSEKFMPMIMAIEHSGIKITTVAIKSKLLDFGSEYNAGSAFFNNNRAGANFGAAGKTENRNEMSKTKKKIKCFKCNRFGHYRNQCPSESKKTDNAFSAVFCTGSYKRSDFYIDSGASSHILVNRDFFISLTDCSKEIMIANKNIVHVKQSGAAEIVTVVGSQTFDVLIRKALFIPEISTNLLSVSALVQNGNEVKFKKDICEILNQQHQFIAVADRVNGVYKVRVCGKPKETCSLTVSSVIWHYRLGHINSNDFQKMKGGAVVGIKCKEDSSFGLKNCSVCCEGKQTRLPFKTKGTRATNALEIVHGDVCGPMENLSIGGARYFLLLVDDYTKMSFVYFLKSKDEVFQSFKTFKSFAENQCNRKIKIFRSDNGCEFVNKNLSDYLKTFGIVHQRTTAYTPGQNGTAERMNRSIVEKARCLLFQENLEKRFWAEAVNTAIYIRNRSTVSGLGEKTPFEMWTRKKPDVSHFKIFGSVAMVHVAKEKRKKWEKKSKRGFFVGYGDNVKGYRVYMPDVNKVIISRDVVLFEN